MHPTISGLRIDSQNRISSLSFVSVAPTGTGGTGKAPDTTSPAISPSVIQNRGITKNITQALKTAYENLSKETFKYEDLKRTRRGPEGKKRKGKEIDIIASKLARKLKK